MQTITTLEELDALYGAPVPAALAKEIDYISDHYKAFIDKAPFVVVATVGPEGMDCSPRGDPPGFVRVLDDGHILIPDRIGNNRFDSYANLFANPQVGILFLVPGMGETLRINGTARVTDDAALLSPSAVQGRAPKFGLLVEVKEAYLHCAKAINRAKLWDPSHHVNRSALPSYGDMLADQVEGLSQAESERQGAEMARRGMY